MGTAAGFFGITYQGPVNGLASNTLSVFNMVRPSHMTSLPVTHWRAASIGDARSLTVHGNGRSAGPSG